MPFKKIFVWYSIKQDMKFNNLEDLLKAWNLNNDEYTITIVNLDSPYHNYIKEEPHHVTDNFNKQQAG